MTDEKSIYIYIYEHNDIIILQTKVVSTYTGKSRAHVFENQLHRRDRWICVFRFFLLYLQPIINIIILLGIEIKMT